MSSDLTIWQVAEKTGLTTHTLRYYEVEGGGHAVPGLEAPSFLRRSIAGSKNRDIDGPTEIWAFFRRLAPRQTKVG